MVGFCRPPRTCCCCYCSQDRTPLLESEPQEKSISCHERQTRSLSLSHSLSPHPRVCLRPQKTSPLITSGKSPSRAPHIISFSSSSGTHEVRGQNWLCVPGFLNPHPCNTNKPRHKGSSAFPRIPGLGGSFLTLSGERRRRKKGRNQGTSTHAHTYIHTHTHTHTQPTQPTRYKKRNHGHGLGSSPRDSDEE